MSYVRVILKKLSGRVNDDGESSCIYSENSVTRRMRLYCYSNGQPNN